MESEKLFNDFHIVMHLYTQCCCVDVALVVSACMCCSLCDCAVCMCNVDTYRAVVIVCCCCCYFLHFFLSTRFVHCNVSNVCVWVWFWPQNEDFPFFQTCIVRADVHTTRRTKQKKTEKTPTLIPWAHMKHSEWKQKNIGKKVHEKQMQKQQNIVYKREILQLWFRACV